MALDVMTSVLVGVLGIVCAVLFVRGLLGMVAQNRDDMHYRL